MPADQGAAGAHPAIPQALFGIDRSFETAFTLGRPND
jgi:hypothetical protein